MEDFIVVYTNYLKEKRHNQIKKLLSEEVTIREKATNAYYEIEDVEFNENTRSATVKFKEKSLYKTVERYTQCNYERTPIYSDWKVKTKTITKHVKLTNDVLENLPNNEDNFISDFASEIVCLINKKHLMPSWFQEEVLNGYYEVTLKNANDEINEQKSLLQSKTKEIDDKLDMEKRKIAYRNTLIEKFNKKLSRKKASLDRTINHKKNMFLSIITLGIYSYFGSNTRKKHINHSISKLNELLDKRVNEKNVCERSIAFYAQQIRYSKKDLEVLIQECDQRVAKAARVRDMNYSKISHLQINENFEENEFAPLIQILGIKHRTFKGVYIIRNKLNNRVYVGQSKDVLFRLNQHFQKDCSPKNIIFAEDYFTAPEEQKNELFEVKIIKCNTKDELDNLEREYIECYDANITGYNRTAGNS